MGILLVIMLITLGLALRTAAVSRRAILRSAETYDDPGLVDAFARTSFLVLFSLFGLLALGMMYGNVLGAGAGS
jgi:hypothetical protein